MSELTELDGATAAWAPDAELVETDETMQAAGADRILDAGSPRPRPVLDATLPEASATSCTTCDASTRAEAAPELCDVLARRAGMSLAAQPRLSFARLLCETVDLERFTRGPEIAYRAKLASSYDRGSIKEGESGWFGNLDHGSYLRDEGDEHVMMESSGPGVITRIWTPNPTGMLRIYVDDREKPAIEASMADLLSGKFESPWGDPFVFVAAQGYSAYFPIPYARYARISTTTSESLYYQVNYREYPAGTEVESYSAAKLKELAPLARQLAGWLVAPDYTGFEQHELHLSEGEPTQRAKLGPAVVRELTVRGFPSDEAALRRTRIILTVDGEQTVDAPLGDLFGAGPGLQLHDSAASSISKDVLSLRWPMPIQGELGVRVASNGGSVGDLRVGLRYTKGVPRDHRVFHAQWTGARSFDTSSPLDWTVLHFRGSGWYVGTLLNVSNPTAWWWGEGDEKIFVDGESFPSNFGTGTEDYFGFGWCSNEIFARPWIGQTRADGPANQGRSSQYRWHVGDAIPFISEVRMTFEVLHWISGLLSVSLSQDAIAYWYATPGGADAAKPLDLSTFEVPKLVGLDDWLPMGVYNCRL